MITAKYKLKSVRRDRVRRVIRQRVNGTAERPRLVIYRSNRYLYAQAVDDVAHRVVTAASTQEKGVREGLKSAKDKEAAKRLGEVVVERLQKLSIGAVVFDRNIYAFTGRIKILADTARGKGIRF